MSYSKEEIINYRLERAHEAFSEAELMLAGRKWRGSVNRLYYTSFYVLSAYFVHKNMKAFTHAGMKTAFNKELVSLGKVSAEEGKLYNQLFSFRQDADYKDFANFEEKDVVLLFPRVEALMVLLEKSIRDETV